MSFVNPYRFAGTSASFAVIKFDTGTTTGNVDYTASLGGLTPKAVLLVGSSHLTADTSSNTDGCQMAIGAGDGTTELCCTGTSRDNVANTATGNIAYSGYSLIMRTADGTSNTTRAQSSFITNGARLNYDTNGTARRGQMALFAGSGLTAKTGIHTFAAGTGAQSVSIGFEPDAVIFFRIGGTFSGSLVGQLASKFGIVVNDGSATQRSVILREFDGQAAGNAFMNLSTSYVASNVSGSDGSFQWGMTAGGFSGSGFTLTASSDQTGAELAYLALALPGQCALVSFDTPTSTGNSTITGAGFTPSFAIVVITNLEAENTTSSRSTSDVEAGYAISFVSTETWGTSARTDPGAGTTDTSSRCTNAVLGPSHAAADAVIATLSAWTSDGMTLNYSAVQGTAKKGFVLFIE